MYESVCYVTTNPRTSTKHKSDSIPIPHVAQGAEDDLNSSSLTPREEIDPPPLPARPLKPMKTKHATTQNVEDVKMYESVCYNVVKLVSGTNTKHDSDSSHIQGRVPLSSSVDPQELDPPPLPLKTVKSKPSIPQQKQIQDDTDKIDETNSGTDIMIKDSRTMPSVKQAADYETPTASSSENHLSLPIRPPKPIKAEPSSTQNEQDIKMYQSVCYNVVNPGTNAKNKSPIQQTEHELSGSSVNPREDSSSPAI